MWPIFLIVATATSGYLAKRFLDASASSKTHDQSDRHSPDASSDSSTSKKPQSRSYPAESSRVLLQSLKDQVSPCAPDVHRSKGASETKDGIFRFSSIGARTTRSRTVIGESPCARLRQKGKRFSVHLKKHRDRKNREKNREPDHDSHLSKENPLLNWGISMGVILMASVGKNEMDKLGAALDETGKLIDELKSELHTRKSMRKLHSSSHITPCKEESCNPEKVKTIEKLGGVAGIVNDASGFSLATGEHVDSDSSVITEEPTHRKLEMDELEAELESELDKISGSMSQELPHSKRRISRKNEIEVIRDIDDELTHLTSPIEAHKQPYILAAQGDHIQKPSSWLQPGSVLDESKEHMHKSMGMTYAASVASTMKETESLREDVSIFRRKRAMEDASFQYQISASTNSYL